MKKGVLEIIAVAFLIIAAGCVSIIEHDENQAAQESRAFAHLAFLCGSDKAFELLATDTVAAHPLSEFHDLLVKMHPDGFPVTLWIDSYEPVFGKEAINLFLEGRNGDLRYHYRMYVEGTKRKGYRVAGFFRSKDPFPSPNYHKALSTIVDISGAC